jgi:hypothetical protein
MLLPYVQVLLPQIARLSWQMSRRFAGSLTHAKQGFTLRGI